MKNSKSVNRMGSSIQLEQGGAKRARVLILSLCLAALAVGAALPTGFLAKVSAAAQQAARRTVTPAPKPKPGAPAVRQSKDAQVVSQGKANPDGSITPDKIITDNPIERTTAEIMADQATRPQQDEARRLRAKKVQPNRENLPEAPGAIEANQWPLPDKNAPITQLGAPQTLGTQFDGATGPTETGAFPPDTMGAVGPTQIVVFLNGRVRTFSKTTGAADGAINADSDVFFASVMTTPGPGQVVFTSDPQVRFDRLSNRWFLNIIDVPLVAASGTLATQNRVLIAVSDAASNGIISGGTVWTFYQFLGDATLFTDYQSFGIDSSAIYIGADMFTLAGAFNSTKGWVIPKAPALTASPLTVWAFSGLVATPASAGPFAPRGVDNYQVAATTEGYFIGVDNLNFNTLTLRRVTNPGSLGPAPTISANISIATPLTTRFPVLVPHLGNTGGTGGRLDGLDDRLFYAHIRNGRLWTSHNVGVDNTGVAGATNNRNAARWYELQNIISPGTPSVLQSGTLFDNNATNDANQRNYWIPSILVTGQGHAALGCSIAGTSERINAFTTGRLVGDTLGTLRDGPGGATLPGYTASSTAYNPPGDPGGPSRRWGDYSNTSLDPKDDMTMWTIQEYCNGTNTYGVRAVKLIAPPPPPTNTASPGAVPLNSPSINVVVTGAAPAGQGYYDPGANPPAPHTTFNHISATGAGIIVNSTTFNTPTQITLNLSSVGSTPGAKTITITNPDGQTTTVQVLLGPTAAKIHEFTANSFDDGRVLLRWSSGYEVDNLGYNVYRETNGQRTRINPQTIAGSALVTGPSVALTAGKSYAWGDQLTRPGTRYWLEDIDLSGKSTWTGPINLDAKGGKAPSVEQSVLLARIGLASSQMTLGQGSTPVERKAEIASLTSEAFTLQTDLAGQPAVKLGVKQEGWYRVRQQDLVAAGLSSTVNARNLQLYVDGRQVPMIVNGEQDGRLDPSDSIEFYGVGLNSTATNTHVYWLVVGGQSGARIKATKTAGGQNAPGSFVAAVERKDRTLYFAGLRNGETENFFGPVVAGTPVDQSLSLTNLASTSSPATLDVYLQGVTQTPHQARVTLNGSVVGTVSFNGQERGKASFAIAQSQLREGVNTVQLIALGGSADISLVDTVKVSYTHTLTADGNQLRAAVKGGQPVTIGGFTSSDVRVMDVTDLNNPQELTGTISGSKNNSSITLTPVGSGTRSLLAFTGATEKNAGATANVPSNWHEEGLQHDYVMITTRDLKPSLGPLKALRESQGLSVAVVDVEDLYDEFSFGNKSPQSIRDFLQFTRDNWRRLPRFVLFAGDSSYDPKNYLGYGDIDLVPTKLYDSAYMEAASDDWFVDFQGTGLPDIASGRLPVRNATEAAALVGKILSYEGSTGANSVLLTSDLNDGYNFAAIGGSLAALLPGDMQVQEVVRGMSDDATVKNQILAAINQGKTIVNYNGHGSVNQWRGNILTNADAAGMTNSQRLAFFVMMTCLNGYFDDPVLDSLAESLLKSSGGAAAVWASAAQCEPGAQEQLNQELYRLLFNGGSLTVGEAAARAKQVVTDADVRRSWVLFGDPAMRLK